MQDTNREEEILTNISEILKDVLDGIGKVVITREGLREGFVLVSPILFVKPDKESVDTELRRKAFRLTIKLEMNNENYNYVISSYFEPQIKKDFNTVKDALIYIHSYIVKSILDLYEFI